MANSLLLAPLLLLMLVHAEAFERMVFLRTREAPLQPLGVGSFHARVIAAQNAMLAQHIANRVRPNVVSGQTPLTRRQDSSLNQFQIPSGSNDEFENQSGSNQQSQNPSDFNKQFQNPSDSNHQSQSPSGSNQQSQNPSGSNQQSQNPSGSNHQSQNPSGSNQQSQNPSGSNQQSQNPSGSNQQSRNPSVSNQQSQSPSDSKQTFLGTTGRPQVQHENPSSHSLAGSQLKPTRVEETTHRIPPPQDIINQHLIYSQRQSQDHSRHRHQEAAAPQNEKQFSDDHEEEQEDSDLSRPYRNPVCNVLPDPGECRAAFPLYYYNTKTGMCDCFLYGGCGEDESGEGSFFSFKECKQECNPESNEEGPACKEIFKEEFFISFSNNTPPSPSPSQAKKTDVSHLSDGAFLHSLG